MNLLPRFLFHTVTALALLVTYTHGEAPFARATVQELVEGDILPDIELVSHLGKRIHLSDFHGKALAVTFIYSRCPSPTLCPMVSLNFDRTQTLLGRLGAADRCHLLSISLDVEHDTPEVLAAYAKACRADERGWTFATGREDDVRRLGRTVGLEFKRVDGKIDHNLRTVVADADGHIRHIFRGGEWSPQELAAELRSATTAPR